jgi:hypothetical protein
MPIVTKAGGGGGVSAHNLLDGLVHPDTAAGGVLQGSLIVGNATPKWEALALGTVGKIPISDGTDLLYRILVAADIPSLDAAKITSGRFPMAQMPEGTDGYVLTGTGNGSSPAYEAIPAAVTPRYGWGGLVSALAANQTRYGYASGPTLLARTNDVSSTMLMPFTCTAKMLYVTMDPPGGTQTTKVTLLKNAVASTLTVTVTGTATTGSDTTHSVSLVAGDSLRMEYVTSATSATVNVQFGFELDPA